MDRTEGLGECIRNRIINCSSYVGLTYLGTFINIRIISNKDNYLVRRRKSDSFGHRRFIFCY